MGHTRGAILTAVQDVLADFVGMPKNEIVEEAHLSDTLGLDSLDLIESTMILEEQFEVDLEDDELDKCQTVGELVSVLCRVLNVQ